MAIVRNSALALFAMLASTDAHAQACANAYTIDGAGSFGTFPAPTSSTDYQFRDLQGQTSNGYVFSTDGTPGLPGEYLVTSGAFANKIFGNGNHWTNMVGHTTGAQNDGFLAVNGRTVAGVTFYSSQVTLPAGQATIRLWAANAVVDTNPNSLPNLGVRLVNITTGQTVAGFDATTGALPSRAGPLPPTTQQWVPAEITGTIPAAGQYRLELYNASTASAGNDFVVDDVSIAPVAQDCAKVTFVKRVVNNNGGTETASNFGIQSRAAGIIGGNNNVTFPTAGMPTRSSTNSSNTVPDSLDYISMTYEFPADSNTYWVLEANRPAYTEGTWSCTGDGVTQTTNPFNNGGFRFSPTRGRNATCTITNDDIPATVTVTKVSNGGVGTFNFSGTNGIANHAVTTATSGTGVAGTTQTLTTAVSTTITEAAPGSGFALRSIACTGLGAGGTATPTINGANGGQVVLNAAATAPGSNIRCTFTNGLLQADLAITKTDNVTVVSRGETLNYVLTVTNNGPDTVTGAVVTDPTGTMSNITCPAGNAVSIGGTGPAPTNGPFTVANLTGAGIALGALASGQTNTFSFQCVVN